MTDKKYRLDMGSIIDNEKGHILSEIQVRNQLNKYHEENMKFKQTAITLINKNLSHAKDEGLILGNAPVERAGGIIELLQELGLFHAFLFNGTGCYNEHSNHLLYSRSIGSDSSMNKKVNPEVALAIESLKIECKGLDKMDTFQEVIKKAMERMSYLTCACGYEVNIGYPKYSPDGTCFVLCPCCGSRVYAGRWKEDRP